MKTATHNAPRTPRALRPLTSRSYRFLAAALGAALFSAGAWTLAAAWYVVEIGGGPRDVALVSSLLFVGIVAAVLVGGAAADATRPRRILLFAMAAKTAAGVVVSLLAGTGTLQVWHLAVGAVVLGVSDGFFYPAYSALLPRLVLHEDLLAANGIEGVLRPAAMMAAGPAVAGLAFSVAAPAAAFGAVAVGGAGSLLALLGVRDPVPAPATPESVPAGGGHGMHTGTGGIAAGLRFALGTRWLVVTLGFASLIVLLVQGPIEVLLPFVVEGPLGGGAAGFSLLLGAFGVGSAVGAIVTASVPLPRRYLTALLGIWGAGTLPLIVVALSRNVWLTAAALFVVGATYAAGAVLWGTLLQRRVPAHLLGRVSSLDFFVSLALLPVSIAIAGPAAEWLGLEAPFLIGALAPVVLAVVAVLVGRVGRDERAHPLA